MYISYLYHHAQTTAHTSSFLISGVRGQVLSAVHTPSDNSVSPLAGGSHVAAPKLSPPQPKSPMCDQEYLIHPLLTTKVQVHKHTYRQTYGIKY